MPEDYLPGNGYGKVKVYSATSATYLAEKWRFFFYLMSVGCGAAEKVLFKTFLSG